MVVAREVHAQGHAHAVVGIEQHEGAPSGRRAAVVDVAATLAIGGHVPGDAHARRLTVGEVLRPEQVFEGLR